MALVLPAQRFVYDFKKRIVVEFTGRNWARQTQETHSFEFLHITSANPGIV